MPDPPPPRRRGPDLSPQRMWGSDPWLGRRGCDEGRGATAMCTARRSRKEIERRGGARLREWERDGEKGRCSAMGEKDHRLG
jgi:hypothetical protein